MKELTFVPQIEDRDGTLIVSSRVVADQLGKEHRNVIRDISNIIENLDDSSNLSSHLFT